MIDWGQKKYGPQAPGIHIGPRVRSGGGGGTTMSKAGTPLKPYTPPKKYQKGGRPLPTKPAPKAAPKRKSTLKYR